MEAAVEDGRGVVVLHTYMEAAVEDGRGVVVLHAQVVRDDVVKSDSGVPR
jgi:hypothetical protein